MSRQTLIRAMMPGPADQGEVEESWTVLTHEIGDEFWSEVLDGHHHPHVHHDEHGYDTVKKFFGDTVEESRQRALQALEELVRASGGHVKSIGKMHDV